MARGDVLVWTGSLWHGGGANTTDGWRPARHELLRWVRPSAGEPATRHPPERMATFNPELRQMCGLGVYCGLIGNIDKKSPPKCSTETPQTHLWDQDPI